LFSGQATPERHVYTAFPTSLANGSPDSRLNKCGPLVACVCSFLLLTNPRGTFQMFKPAFCVRALLAVAAVALLACGTAFAQYPSSYQATPNVFGGHNYSGGGYSTPNVMGGQNYYGPGGSTMSSSRNVFGGQNYSNGWSSQPNVFGGQNFQGPGGQSFSTQRNVFGGQNYSNGGYTTPGVGGGYNYWGR